MVCCNGTSCLLGETNADLIDTKVVVERKKWTMVDTGKHTNVQVKMCAVLTRSSGWYVLFGMETGLCSFF